MKLLDGLTTLALLTAAIPSAADEPATPKKITTVEGITEYRLDNGLKVLLFPEPSRPKVTVVLTVFVGSKHEGYGEAGMAHLLEHMLFKGTPDHPNVWAALTDRGAKFGGFTQEDCTNYHETLNATVDNLDFALRLKADRLVHSNVKGEDLAAEFSVVRNEFELFQDRPSLVLNQRMKAVAYEWHNYGKATLGNRSDIERVPIESLRAFYHKYYQPDNAVLVVAGQFDPAKALKLIRKHFGPLPRPTRKLGVAYTEEPAQDGERSVTLCRVGDVQIFGAMYHIPAVQHADLPALEVLADALVAAPSGRLYKALVETNKVAGVSSNAGIYRDPGIFEVAAVVRKDRSLDEVRDEVLKIIEGVKEYPLTREEVERSKVRLLKNIEPEAVDLGRWTALGDWRLYFLRRDRLEKVTTEQIKEAAEKYFRASNRTTGVFTPTDKADRMPIPVAPDVAGLVDGYKGRDASGAGEAFDTELEAIQRRVITPEPIGGVKLVFLPKKNRGETVSLSMTLRYGNAESLKGLTEAAEFLPQLMLRGTKSLSHQQIQDKLEQNRADLSLTLVRDERFTSSTGSLVVRLETRRKFLPAVLDLLRQILREPTLPADQLEILKTERLAIFESFRTDPQPLSKKLLQIINPYSKDDVRYSPTMDEVILHVKATTIDQVKSLYDDFLSADHGEVAVVGDFEPSEVLPLVAKAVEGWHAKRPFARIEKPHKVVEGGRVVINTPDKANAALFAGLTVSMRDDDPAYPAALIGNLVLGGGGVGGLPSSRLSDRLRQKDGLSYGASSEFSADAEDENASLTIYAIFNPANLSKVEAGVREEFDRLLRGGVTLDELDKARKGYLQERKVGRTSDASLASTLANNLRLGRTLAFDANLERDILALTPDAVNTAVRKYFDPKALTWVVAGDFKKAEPEKKGDAPK